MSEPDNVTITDHGDGNVTARCSVCRSFTSGPPSYVDEAWFRGAHRHERSPLPPSLEPAPRKRRT